MRTTVVVLAVLAASIALAQTPTFESAVIKPISAEQFYAPIKTGQKPHFGVTIDKNRVDMGYQTLSDIVARAYEVAPFQIVGPDYLKTEHYDILAKLPAGASEAQVPQMLQGLLAQRFGLKMHRDKKEGQIYALVVSKTGLKRMKPATAEEMAPEPMKGDQTQSTPFGNMTMRPTPGNGMVGFMPGFGTLKVSVGPAGEHIELSNLTTARFAQMLTSGADRVVIDKTGLQGSYEASFDISLDGQRPRTQSAGGEAGVAAGMVSATALNPMFQAVEQLGLQLEQQKDLVDTIVVDNIEKTPTEK